MLYYKIFLEKLVMKGLESDIARFKLFNVFLRWVNEKIHYKFMVVIRPYFFKSEASVSKVSINYSLSEQRHPYHLVDPSPWPFVTSLAAFLLATGAAMYIHSYSMGGYFLLAGFFMLVYCMFVWWRDVIREGTFQGHHTLEVQKSLRYGMLLFILSEVMFFVAFFWAFFHSSLTPVVDIGLIWPPKGIVPFNPWEIPLLNTLILLLSGATVTWSHYSILSGNRTLAVFSLFCTVCLGLIFTLFQAIEYYEAPFALSDGVYGSTFFMATGFHGFHVLIGTAFLLVCFFRLLAYHFPKKHHFGFEAASWYWHFVDVVWLFLFVSIYWWGGA